jgi:hypothetical protein
MVSCEPESELGWWWIDDVIDFLQRSRYTLEQGEHSLAIARRVDYSQGNGWS